MAADHDLTGRWSGIYNFREILPPNNFEAQLRDVGGDITGVTTERDDDPYGSGNVLHAIVEGHRNGNSVTFTKIYDELEPEPVVIYYDGVIDPGGDEIHGQWERPGMWAGTFLMVRTSGAEEEAVLEAGVEVPTD
jgi:hypothetical protein